MRKKNYKGMKVTKRMLSKCEGVCRNYDAIQYAYADLLSKAEDVQSFRVNVLLEGLQEGDTVSFAESEVHTELTCPDGSIVAGEEGKKLYDSLTSGEEIPLEWYEATENVNNILK